MHIFARVSVRGQVAIPKKVREALDIKDGDTVLFELKGGEVRLRKVKNFLEFKGSLVKSSQQDEIISQRSREEITKSALRRNP